MNLTYEEISFPISIKKRKCAPREVENNATHFAWARRIRVYVYSFFIMINFRKK